MLPNAETVAAAFERILRRDLTASEYREVLRRNRTEKYSGNCCASHDFLDANMSMLEAMTECTGMGDSEIIRAMFPEDNAGMVPAHEAANSASDPEMLLLWGEAWELWHRSTGKLPPLPPSDADPATGATYGDLT
jgi:hypothetical protein